MARMKRTATSKEGVFKEGSLYGFRAKFIDPATGRPRDLVDPRRFKTQKLAVDARATFLVDLGAGREVAPPKDYTLQGYLDEVWLPRLRRRAKTGEIQDSTRVWYEEKISRYITKAPFGIGQVKLRGLRKSHVDALYDHLLDVGGSGDPHANRGHADEVYDLIERLRSGPRPVSFSKIAEQIAATIDGEEGITKNAVARISARSQQEKPVRVGGLSRGHVMDVHTVLKKILGDAVDEDPPLIIRNVAASTTPRKIARAVANPKPKNAIWSPTQLVQFLGFVKERSLRSWVAFLFVALTGQRRGMVCGVRWSDCEFERSEVRVGANTIRVIKHVAEIRPHGKTADGHWIAMPGPLVDALKALRARQNEERLIFGCSHTCTANPDEECVLEGYHDHDLVFAHPDGMPLHPEDDYYDQFVAMQERFNREHPDAELPRANVHALRHAWNTMAKKAGYDDHRLKAQMAWSSTAMAEVYVHVEADHEMAEDVARRLLGGVG